MNVGEPVVTPEFYSEFSGKGPNIRNELRSEKHIANDALDVFLKEHYVLAPALVLTSQAIDQLFCSR